MGPQEQSWSGQASRGFTRPSWGSWQPRCLSTARCAGNFPLMGPGSQRVFPEPPLGNCAAGMRFRRPPGTSAPAVLASSGRWPRTNPLQQPLLQLAHYGLREGMYRCLVRGNPEPPPFPAGSSARLVQLSTSATQTLQKLQSWNRAEAESSASIAAAAEAGHNAASATDSFRGVCPGRRADRGGSHDGDCHLAGRCGCSPPIMGDACECLASLRPSPERRKA